LPHVRIYHTQRSSVRSFNGENIYYFHMMRSRIIYFYKHYCYMKRLFIRSMHVFGVLFRIIILPFRREYGSKKHQKYFQYKMMLKILFSNYQGLLKMKMIENKRLKSINKSNELIKDKYWN
jgi:hypothetical protein